jgi:hypothetical protein
MTESDLLHRIFVVKPDGPACTQTKWDRHESTWGAVIANSFTRATTGEREAEPTLEDFGLTVEAERPLTAVQVCKGRERTQTLGNFPAGFWVTFLDAKQLVIRADPQYLLVLKRFVSPPHADPGTIDCKAPASETEQTICSDPVLLSWDQSVAAAMASLKALLEEDDDRLTGMTREYFDARAACGTDKECVEYEATAFVSMLIQSKGL